MNKKILNIIMLVIGIALFAFGGVFLKGEAVKSFGGVCIGVGAGMFGMSISNLWMLNFNKKHPDELKQSEIEFADERNSMIRNKAKAKTADIIQWFIMGIAYMSIMINAPLWVTLIIVGIFLLKNILELYLMSKYQKEL